MEGEREGWGSNNHPPVGLVSKQPCVNMFVCKFKLNVLQNHLFFQSFPRRRTGITEIQEGSRPGERKEEGGYSSGTYPDSCD